MCWPHQARAGRTHFGWLYGSELIAESGVELETWIVEENKKGETKKDETSFWWGPVVALSAHLEMAVSMEAAHENDHVAPASDRFTRWGADLRYRPQSPDIIDAGPVATLFRIGVKRIIDERAGIRGEADMVVSYQQGAVFVALDLGAVLTHLPTQTTVELRPGAGVSIRTIDDLRLGAELYGELPLNDDSSTRWLVVGPTVSYTRGRFWGAATYGVGLFGLRDAPRITFGLAL
jgi:hypothetical protein